MWPSNGCFDGKKYLIIAKPARNSLKSLKILVVKLVEK
jgi:hypothetical protein